MSACIITMKSRTAAERGRRALPGVGAEIVSLDPGMTRYGCSFGLKLACRDAARLKAALDKQGIPYGEVIGGTGAG